MKFSDDLIEYQFLEDDMSLIKFYHNYKLRLFILMKYYYFHWEICTEIMKSRGNFARKQDPL